MDLEWLEATYITLVLFVLFVIGGELAVTGEPALLLDIWLVPCCEQRAKPDIRLKGSAAITLANRKVWRWLAL